MPYTTFADAVEHALTYIGADPTARATNHARRAVVAAYQELPNRFEWKFYRAGGRVVTSAPYTTGTIAFDYAGGAYDLLVTLSDGTWPEWAASGVLMIADVPYPVSARKSGTQLTLAATANPGEDVAAGTSFTLYRDTYPLPDDYLSGNEVVLDTTDYTLIYRDSGYLENLRRRGSGPAKPLCFGVGWNGVAAGAQAIRFWPAPDARYEATFQYRRRPRALVNERKEHGYATSTAASTTLTGQGTHWTAALVGAVIRLAPDATAFPTSVVGETPFAQERVIASVESTTSLTVTEAFDESLTNVKYVASDPLDVDPDAMMRYFYREIERQVRLITRTKPTEMEESIYQRALSEARAADTRYTGPRSAGGQFPARRQLRDYPLGTEFSSL